MRKILLLILIAICFVDANAQNVNVIKVEQYKIIIDRTVSRFGGICYTWSNPGIGTDYCVYFGSNNQFSKCRKVDNSCNFCSANNDFLATNFYKSGVLQPQFQKLIKIGNISPGTTKQFSDTLNLYQTKFDITTIENNLSYNQPRQQGSWNSNPADTLPCATSSTKNSFNPTGLLFDYTLILRSDAHYFYGYSQNGCKYNTSTRIRVVINTDPVLTLPSHDPISIIQTTPVYAPNWQYRLSPFTDNWLPVSVPPTGIRGDTLQLSGYGLLGNDYLNHLNETIQIRAGGDLARGIPDSDPATFILRLSSPHILSVAPTNLNCFERNEGSIKIQFDRQFLKGERLNILLYDTLNRVNFSAFNLDKLASDNSYTWPNELRAGDYFISLLGKYARGVEYDLDVSTRKDTVKVYTALNSINFMDGFNTPAVDSFEAYTDFGAYSIATFTGAASHFAYQRLTQPEKIRFSVNVDSNILCKGTSAGIISVKVSGGVNLPYNNPVKKYFKYSLKHSDSSNYTNFVNFVQTIQNPYYYNDGYEILEKITGVHAGKYLMHVRDIVDCYARDSAGNEITYAFEITEPLKAITADRLEISPITSVDSTNGYFKIDVTGGTQMPTGIGTEGWKDEAYKVRLYDSASSAVLQDNVNYSDTTINNVYSLQTAHNLKPGTYILELYDKSYGLYNSTNPYNKGCFFELHIPFVKPDSLKVHIVPQRNVSCNNEKDAVLKALAKGGIYNDSTRYKFEWYQLTGANQSTKLPGTDTAIHVMDSIITGLGTGAYRVQVTDKYGNAKSDTILLSQPSLMQLKFTTKAASCYSSFNGGMSVIVTGGTPYLDTAHSSYHYEWSNGALTSKVDSVAGGNYLLVVRDSVGCIAQDTVSVTSPVRVLAINSVHPVSCYNSADGSISLAVSGREPGYTYIYTWNNGNITSNATGLVPGTYWYTVADANGCFDTDTITLTRPDTILVNLGPDRKLCIGQTIRITAVPTGTSAPLTYNWQGNNGYSANTAKAYITDSGNYVLSVTDTARGCTIRDTIQVSNLNDSINTDFIVSSQAFKNESVILVNLSRPYPPDSLLWITPQLGNTVRVLNQTYRNCELLFADTGRYEITMKVYYKGGCIDDTTKYVNVLARDNFGNIGSQANAYLKLYSKIRSNPNRGSFTVDLTFSEATRARMRLVNTLTNQIVDSRDVNFPDNTMHSVQYDLSSMALSGFYALLIDTPKGSFVAKVEILR